MTNYEIDEERRREKRAREIATWRLKEQSPPSDMGTRIGLTEELQERFEKRWPAQYDPPMRYTEGDEINHPAHYTFSKIEVLDAIEAWGLDYHSGNIVKYMARAGRKSHDRIKDLKKAQFYLDRLIINLEKETEKGDAERS